MMHGDLAEFGYEETFRVRPLIILGREKMRGRKKEGAHGNEGGELRC